MQVTFIYSHNVKIPIVLSRMDAGGRPRFLCRITPGGLANVADWECRTLSYRKGQRAQ